VDYLDAIRRDSDLFYATAEGADPSLGVPCCPDWTIADLVWHLGKTQWFWATDVEMRATTVEHVQDAEPGRPGDYAGTVAWGRAQTDHLIDALRATPDDVAVWTWAQADSDHTVGFIRRHQVQEAAVHRWDIQSAASTAVPDPIDPDAASDSIDEVLAVTLPWGVRPDSPLPGSVHLHCTDTPGEWIVHADGRVEAVHAKGGAAIRGTASDILLALYDRIPVDALEVVGDEALARELVARINTS